MPRDASDTKNALLVAAERLFAEQGVYNVTNREITEAAGQRNVSAVNYHFGSRDGLVGALLLDRDQPLDVERGAGAALLGDDPATAEILRVLVAPLEGCLESQRGRDYLRIVAQFQGRFAELRSSDSPTHRHLRDLVGQLEERPAGIPEDVRRERVVAMITLMTTSMAERARQIEASQKPALDHRTHIDNLVDMLVAVIEAPALDRV